MSYQSDPDKLWRAVADGDADLCLDLLKRHHQIPGYVDFQGERRSTTPLCCAIQNSYLALTYEKDGPLGHFLLVVKHLLDYGADASFVSNDGSTALHWAVLYTHTNEFMHLLFANSPDLDVNVKVDGRTPLMVVISDTCNHREIYKDRVLALLEHGAHVDTVDMHGNSLLHQICTVDEWTLNTLETYHADINQMGQFGRTPIHHALNEERDAMYWAARDNNRYVSDTGTIDLLLSHGANIYITDDAGRSAEQFAMSLFPEEDHPIRELFAMYTRRMAFAMGTHRRTNPDDCLVQVLPTDVVQLINSYLYR
jgi:ankyrin repeat protein